MSRVRPDHPVHRDPNELAGRLEFRAQRSAAILRVDRVVYGDDRLTMMERWRVCLVGTLRS